MARSSIPPDLHYTAEHEWIKLSTSDDGTTLARIGITDYAQESLGDVVFLQLPEQGTSVTGGEAVGEVESTKSVSDVFAPLAGTVAARNDAVETNPELLNTDPYGQGWLFELTLADADAVNGLLDAAAYAKLVES